MGSANTFLLLIGYLLLTSLIVAAVMEDDQYLITVGLDIPIETSINLSEENISFGEFQGELYEFDSDFWGWEFTEYGLTSISDSSKILLRTIARSDNGIYDIKYTFNNSVGNDMSIVVYEHSWFDYMYVDLDFNSNECIIKDGMLYTKEFSYDIDSYKSNLIINTIYDSNEGSLSFIVNDHEVFYQMNLNTPAWFYLQPVNYGGVFVFGEGTHFQHIETINTPKLPTEKEPLDFAWSFLTNLLSVLFWTVNEEIFPFWLNLILIKAPLFTLFYIVALLIRGGG